MLYPYLQSLFLRRTNPPVNCPSSLWRATNNARRHLPIPRRQSVRASGGWRVLGHVRCGTGSSASVCVLPVVGQHAFHSGAARGRETLHRDAAIWTAWCKSSEKRIRGRREARNRPAKSMDRGRRRKRSRRCGEYCTVTMRVLSRSPGGFERMTVIAASCAACRLMVSEAKTEIMYLQRKMQGEGAVHRHCSRPGIQTHG